jgi:molybdenum cofactor biosynthesis protein B
MSEFVPLGVAVLTISDTRTRETDKSGALAEEELSNAGHSVVERTVIKDDLETIRDNLRRLIADSKVAVVVTTGGTGITARDVTPDALAPLVDKPVVGFGELFRQLSYADIGAATIQSRAEAALCGKTLVFVLPGSTGAVRLALEKIILPQLDARTKPCNFVDLLPRV